MRSLLERIAGAPITWGVCEVPGWGLQLGPHRVLDEIASVGLRATERGPEGFLPASPEDLRTVLASRRLSLAGGFVPAVLHLADRLDRELESVARAAAELAACGAPVLVLAADTPHHGYESSAELGEEEWRTLIAGVDRAVEIGRQRGLAVTLHPHYGTVIEGPAEVERLLERSSVALCLDTGHLMVGGADPLDVARKAADRVAHVHLKDVDGQLAARVRGGSVGYRDAVALGLYPALGEGDVDIRAIVEALEGAGFDGWYVIEQDTVLEEEPAPGTGPVAAALESLRFLRRVAEDIEGRRSGAPVPGSVRPVGGRSGAVGRSHEAAPEGRRR